MTKETKPTSKVIQITSCMNDNEELLRALCEDGSIWQEMKFGQWQCLLEPHKKPVEEEPTLQSKKERFNNVREKIESGNVVFPTEPEIIGVDWAVKADKLPEVGKRYKHKRDQNIVKAVYIFEHGDITLEAEGGKLLGEVPLVYLQEHYEELPDQEPTN